MGKKCKRVFAEMDKQEVSKQEKEYKSLSVKERKEKDRELKLKEETLKKKVKCREIEFSLPIELGSKENYIKFAQEYCKEIMGIIMYTHLLFMRMMVLFQAKKSSCTSCLF